MRLVLERLAVSAAAANHSEQNCAALHANLAEMAAAINAMTVMAMYAPI